MVFNLINSILWLKFAKVAECLSVEIQKKEGGKRMALKALNTVLIAFRKESLLVRKLTLPKKCKLFASKR
jgi:hypothetical protein